MAIDLKGILEQVKVNHSTCGFSHLLTCNTEVIWYWGLEKEMILDGEDKFVHDFDSTRSYRENYSFVR